MANNTIVYGALLIALGVLSYILTQGVSITALIPAAFGVVQVALGMLAKHESRRKHMMHLAAALGLLAFAGSVSGFLKVITSLSGTALQRPAAAYSQSIMALLSAGFVALCINSFIQARRARQNTP